MVRFPVAATAVPRHVESIRALLTDRSENPIEIVRSLYLPRLNSQPQCTRRDWKELLSRGVPGRNARIVENRDTGKFGNGFFEKLQPLPA